MGKATAEAIDAKPFPARAIGLGLALCAIFTFGAATWMAIAPLSSAVIASGVVSVESFRKAVQHLEGGIIGTIKVKDGDRVEEGDVVIQMHDVASRAGVERLQTQYYEALATTARLVAEREEAQVVAFPAPLTDNSADPAAASAMAGQIKVFESRDRLRRETFSVIDKKIAQIQESNIGLEGQLASVRTQLDLHGEELKDAEQLYEKKLLRKSRFLEIKRRRAALEGKISELDSSLAENAQEILELRLKQSEAKAAHLASIDEQLRQERAKVYETSRELAAASDVLARSLIRSPIAGTVVNLQVHSRDGVIAAGQTLMEIVPDSDDLVVEARVRPEDIEVVREGLPAHVVLTTLNRRYNQPIQGRLESVSADRISDPVTGLPYYRVRVNLDPASVRSQGTALVAGMGADVFIQTGERTALGYLAAPIVKTFHHGMREN